MKLEVTACVQEVDVSVQLRKLDMMDFHLLTLEQISREKLQPSSTLAFLHFHHMLVAAQWTLLACVAGASVFGLVYTRFGLLSTYLLLWSIFHMGEYTVTFLSLPRTLTPHSFLVYGARGSVHLAGVHLATIAEHVVTKRLWSSMSFQVSGALVAASGMLIRWAAIATCGDSFSHYIETLSQSQLVTHGIYRWCRHPSYLGFLVYVVGMQAVVGNLVTMVLSLVVLWRFFKKRMDVEEWFLVNRLYGQAYVEYMGRTRRLVPGVY